MVHELQYEFSLPLVGLCRQLAVLRVGHEVIALLISAMLLPNSHLVVVVLLASIRHRTRKLSSLGRVDF